MSLEKQLQFLKLKCKNAEKDMIKLTKDKNKFLKRSENRTAQITKTDKAIK